MYSPRPTPTPTMYDVHHPALVGGGTTSSGAYTSSSPLHSTADTPRGNLAAAYAHPQLDTWPPPPRPPQNSAYGAPYPSHGPPSSSFVSGSQGELLPGPFDPRGIYGSHHAAVPRGVRQAATGSHARDGTTSAASNVSDARILSPFIMSDSRDVRCGSYGSATSLEAASDFKQEVKQEDPGMDWLAPHGGQPYVPDAPQGGYDPAGYVVPKEESRYEDDAAYSSSAAPYPHGSTSPTDHGFAAHEYHQGSYQPWPYASPPLTPSDDLYDGEAYAPRPPTPIQNNRSYTLANAMIPVTPVERPPTVPSSGGRRPIMDYLPHPEDLAESASPSRADEHSPPAPTASPPVAPPSQPVRRGRGRPRKHPLPARASPPPAVAYPYPPLDGPVHAPPRRWPAEASLDEIPFPEGAEHPGQQVFKLTSPGVPKEPVKKKPIMACLFCRERKIACGQPPAGAPEQRCNQCARRDLVCEYPKESRRGMHKRFPRVAKAKEQGVAVDPGARSPSASPPAAEKQGARRRAGKERERPDVRKAAQRGAGASV